MPSWEELLNMAKPHKDPSGQMIPGIPVDELRKRYMTLLHQKTGRNVIAYYSGWLQPGREDNVDVNDRDMTGFMNAVKGLDCTKGLDLILHTPGGFPTSAESIVNYLHSMFHGDIRVIVPHKAMSAGTMISCASKCIIMGAHSCLGPVDPQFGGTPAYNIIKEFSDAKEDLQNNPDSASFWSIQLRKYPIAFLYTAKDAIELSDELVGKWLRNYMFADEDKDEREKKVRRIKGKLNSNNKSHGRPYNYDFCKDLGMKVVALEDDPTLQELVLSVHHTFDITLSYFPVTKIIQNHIGAHYITQQTQEG